MKNFQRPIERLKEDVSFYKAQLIEAKIQHKHALSRGSVLLANRLVVRIDYFERRIAVSESELNRFLVLYDMTPDEQLKARLISANKFAFPKFTEPVEVSKGYEGILC